MSRVSDKKNVISAIADLDGRWLIILAVATCFSIIIFGSGQTGPTRTWHWFGVSHMSPSFADLRSLTSACDTYRSGHDPFQANLNDAWQRSFNYPRVWLLLSFLGLGEKQTEPLGIGMTAMFYGTLLYLVGRVSPGEGILYGLLVCSPAVLLAVERGNTDLIIFALLGGSAILFERTAFRWWPYLIVLFCSILKLYPICALAVAIRERWERAVALVALGTFFFALYLAATWTDLAHVMANTPQLTNKSYGSRIFFEGLRRHGLPVQPQICASALLLGVLVLVFWLTWRFSVPRFSPGALEKFVIGGSIYAGTFALLKSFNYRLVFLLLLVPQLLLWWKSEHQFRWWSGFGLCCVTVGALYINSTPPRAVLA